MGGISRGKAGDHHQVLPIQGNCQGGKHSFNGGYLFLQKIYHELKLNKLCKEISLKYKFTFNLDSVLSRLLYARIIYPFSKLATFQLSTKFIEQPDFELKHIYREHHTPLIF